MIHAALEAGVTLLDTAHAYALGAHDMGHNERLVARALASWTGDPSPPVRVVTKGGMTRPEGRWVPDGRARALRAGAEASARALGVTSLDVFLLHAPDPRTPLATSVRALERIRREGLARSVGLCNVRAHQIREALDLAEIDVVQVALGPFDDDALRNGVAALCVGRGITLLAHTPLGGPSRASRLARDEVLARLGGRHGIPPAEVALAWLLALGVIPIPGATRAETARSAGHAARVRLDEEDLAELDRRFPAGRSTGWSGGGRARGSKAARDAPTTTGSSDSGDAGGDEVVLLMGIPGAGKSVLARSLVEAGYQRLNRDERGGRLRELVGALESGLAGGRRRFVLDNTYASRAERQRVLEAAHAAGVPVRCVWLDTPLEEAQVNAVLRMLERYGRLLGPDEIRRESRRDPAALGPGALFRFRRSLEPPAAEEGFSRLEVWPFERRWPGERPGRALVVEYDGVLRRSRRGDRAPAHEDDVEVPGSAGEVLRAWASRGYRLLGLAWHPEVAEGRMTDARVAAVMRRTHELLGVELEGRACTHAAGPPACWCRKPLPGLLVELFERHRIDPARSLLVGPSSADRTLAARMGVPFMTPEDLLAGRDAPVGRTPPAAPRRSDP